MKTEIQEFQPAFEVLERSLAAKIRPSPKDLRDFAQDSMRDVGDYVSDPKLRCQAVREARRTIRMVDEWEGPDG